MATRRMFSKSITNSSRFLMMPQTSQNLYFHLGMNADDDGFVEHFTIMRMVEAKPDDLNVLKARGFVKVFDEKVLIILDWKENNYLRMDRYSPSKYLEIYKAELASISEETQSQSEGLPLVYQMATQVRLGKDSISNTKNSKTSDKEKENILEKFIVVWNEVYKTTLKPSPSLLANFSHWLDVYSYDEIISSVRNSKNDKFWSDKLTPTIFLRRKNPQGENVDRISDFLNQKHIPVNEDTIDVRELVPGWDSNEPTK